MEYEILFWYKIYFILFFYITTSLSSFYSSQCNLLDFLTIEAIENSIVFFIEFFPHHQDNLLD